MEKWKLWKSANKNAWNYNNGWYEGENEENYGWVKRTIAAIIIFTAVYAVHISETNIGQSMDEGIKFVLTKETDFTKLSELIGNFGQDNIDLSVFKYIQNRITKPANPLQYMTRPLEGTIVNNPSYGPGWMIKTAPGENVRAAAKGKVKVITDSLQHGKMLIIEHGQGVETIYGRLNETIVMRGDAVSQGQIIARVARNDKDGAMLYFEIRENGQPIDPANNIKGSFPREGK